MIVQSNGRIQNVFSRRNKITMDIVSKRTHLNIEASKRYINEVYPHTDNKILYYFVFIYETMKYSMIKVIK